VLTEYVQEALERARYEIIQDEDPYYGEVPELPGVWASGKTLEACREHLRRVVEGWIALRLSKGLAVPPLGEHRIEAPTEVAVGGQAYACLLE